MKKRILFPFFIFCCICTYGQGRHITIDPDGYTNIREKPNAQSRILGKVTKHQVFYHPDVSCGFEETKVGKNLDLNNKNWIPVFISEKNGLEAGYIFRKNIRALDKLPQLGFTKSDKYNVVFSDKNIRIGITTEPFDNQKYILKRAEGKDVTINGEPVSPWPYEKCFQLKQIEIVYNGTKTKFPESEIEKIFFLNNPIANCYKTSAGLECDIKVFKSENGLYFLSISGGDGAESFDTVWTIENGKSINKDTWWICAPPELIMVYKLASQF